MDASGTAATGKTQPLVHTHALCTPSVRLLPAAASLLMVAWQLGADCALAAWHKLTLVLRGAVCAA